MWRTNTDGQKTLCNACGVRLHREQKKAKIARSGSETAKVKADPGVQLLPRSRSKSQSLTPEAKVCSLLSQWWGVLGAFAERCFHPAR